MARFQVRSGDSGDVPVTFEGGTVQEFVVFRDTGTITVTTTACSLYAYLNGIEFAKVPRDSTRAYAVQNGMTFDVIVTGTTDAQPSGSVHYSMT